MMSGARIHVRTWSFRAARRSAAAAIHGLLDRLVLMIAPITLGAGKRLFGDAVPAGAFKLIEHRLTPGGMAMATYEPAGPVKTGSFATAEPTEAERRRRTTMEAGDW